MKFTYTFQVSVHHVLRVNVVQATDDTHELGADVAMVVRPEIITDRRKAELPVVDG